MRRKILVSIVLSLSMVSPIFSQAAFDNIFICNSAILNMIPNLNDKQNYIDVFLIASLAPYGTSDHSSVVIERVPYKEKFGSFSPTDEVQKSLIAFNDDNAFRIGRVQVKKSTPKQICIFPEYSAGSVWKYSDSSSESIVIPIESTYVLIYKPSEAKNTFYKGNGSALDDSYANLDGKGRITEIFQRGGSAIAGFHYRISYNENGKIASVEELELTKDRKGTVIKKVKSSLKLFWKGNNVTSFTITPYHFESDEYNTTIDYSLEVKETNSDGLWTKAVLSHKDENCVGGKYIDCEYNRAFNTL